MPDRIAVDATAVANDGATQISRKRIEALARSLFERNPWLKIVEIVGANRYRAIAQQQEDGTVDIQTFGGPNITD